MAGKGDHRRPQFVSREQYDQNWNRAFGKATMTDPVPTTLPKQANNPTARQVADFLNRKLVLEPRGIHLPPDSRPATSGKVNKKR
jgi:hypothetical protein